MHTFQIFLEGSRLKPPLAMASDSFSLLLNLDIFIFDLRTTAPRRDVSVQSPHWLLQSLW